MKTRYPILFLLCACLFSTAQAQKHSHTTSSKAHATTSNKQSSSNNHIASEPAAESVLATESVLPPATTEHTRERSPDAAAEATAASRPARSFFSTNTNSVATASAPSSKAAATIDSTASQSKTNYAPAQHLLVSALGLIGIRYQWGGTSPESGFDCSGFVQYVFKNSLKIALPRSAMSMSKIGDPIKKDELKPGDLVFFNTLRREFSHVGIYVGDDRFIHSPSKGRSVEVVSLNDKYWTAHFNGARRVADHGDEPVNLAELLTESSKAGSKSRANSDNSGGNASSASCRKVTTGKGAKKHVKLICPSNTDKDEATSSTKTSSSKASPKKGKAVTNKTTKAKTTKKKK